MTKSSDSHPVFQQSHPTSIRSMISRSPCRACRSGKPFLLELPAHGDMVHCIRQLIVNPHPVIVSGAAPKSIDKPSTKRDKPSTKLRVHPNRPVLCAQTVSAKSSGNRQMIHSNRLIPSATFRSGPCTGRRPVTGNPWLGRFSQCKPDFGVTSVNYDLADLLARAEVPR